MKYTVQCLFAGWWSNEVIVEADSLDAACAKAIEEAGQDDGWRSIDDCGPTFVTRICEGEHDMIYSPEAAKHQRPIPYEHGERATGDIRDSRELATILAALRYYQRTALGAGGAIPEDEILEDAGVGSLDGAEIDALCERLNMGGA